jgi:hypothetical protein
MPDEVNPVIEHLELAMRAARDQEMSASEIIGLLHYYAHNIAQDARESALREQAVQEASAADGDTS